MNKAFGVIFFIAAIIIVVIFLANTYLGSYLTPQGGIFISQDNGISWQRAGSVENKRRITNIDSFILESNPRDPRILYWGTIGDSILKSIDGGVTWHRISDANGILSSKSSVYSIAADPVFPDYSNKIPDKFYIGVTQNKTGKILKTEDGGISFKEVYVSPKQNNSIFSIEVNPQSPNIVWAGTSDGLLLKSKDYGETWKLINKFDSAIKSIIFRPSNSNNILLATYSSGIFSSYDGGDSWNKETMSVKNYSGSYYINKIVLDYSENVYMVSSIGLLRSFDWCKNWELVNIVFPDKTLSVFDVVFGENVDEIYVSAGNFIFSTKDGGEFWQIRKLATSKNIRLLFVDTSTGVILAGAGK